MKLLKLTNNALFLRNWYEQTRKKEVVIFSVIAGMIIMLIFLYCFLQRAEFSKFAEASKTWHGILWQNFFLMFLAGFQGVLLPLIGLLLVVGYANKELASGTIDYHRMSPTKRIDQIIGMVFGPPVLAWIIFLESIGIVLLTVLSRGISLAVVFTFYASLILCTVFYHSIAVLFGLSIRDRVRPDGAGIAILWVLMIALFIPLSAAYYLTFIPGYNYLFMNMFRPHEAGLPVHPLYQLDLVSNYFFGKSLHFLLFQIIVQVPLIVMIWLGISRKISYPGRPIFSKLQSLALSLLILLYYTGSALSLTLVGGNEQIISHWKQIAILLPYLWYFMGMFMASGATPEVLMFVKGLRRMKRLNLTGISPLDDQSSNWLWLIGYCLLSVIMFFLFFVTIHLHPGKFAYTTAIIMIQIIFYAQLLEYVKLSASSKRAVFFKLFVGLSVLWLIVPLIGIGLIADMQSLQYLLAPSPVFIYYLLMQSLLSAEFSIMLNYPALLLINAALAVFSVSFARHQRQALHKQILSNP